jgi:hypothetical protein
VGDVLRIHESYSFGCWGVVVRSDVPAASIGKSVSRWRSGGQITWTSSRHWKPLDQQEPLTHANLEQRLWDVGDVVRLIDKCELADVLFRRHVEEGAGTGVFQHPQRTVWTFFHIADAVADGPTFGGLGSAFAAKDNAVERRGLQSAQQRRTISLREHRALVEHQISRRDDGRPIDHELGQIGARVRAGDRHTITVGSVRHQRPAIVLAGFDQIQFAAAPWPCKRCTIWYFWRSFCGPGTCLSLRALARARRLAAWGLLGIDDALAKKPGSSSRQAGGSTLAGASDTASLAAPARTSPMRRRQPQLQCKTTLI